jgi:hypothetical protein
MKELQLVNPGLSLLDTRLLVLHRHNCAQLGLRVDMHVVLGLKEFIISRNRNLVSNREAA